MTTPSPVAPTSAKRVSDRPGNTDGAVFIVEYHHVAEGTSTMHRSPAAFRKDLERFHRMGFRPVTVSQYLDNKMPLPPGASPMVFTFDDSNPSQFQLRPDGTVDPNCAIGIWQEFAAKHPDFPVRATFYVLPDVMFGQPGLERKKVDMLRAMGCELGNHTMTHPILRRLPDDKVKYEIGEANARLEALDEPMPTTLAFPFGSSPKNVSLEKGFTYKGKPVQVRAALLVGANPAPAPTSKKLNRFRIPRIQGYSGEFGIDYWLGEVEKGRVKLYVQP